ncbi:HNH endonuclease [Erwinia phage phiEa116]|nr:HNH endonuclease [Erwinia phage phiEa116]
MKVCSTCKIEKTSDSFAVNNSKKSGLQSSCKSCQNEKNKRRYAQSAERRNSIGATRKITVDYNRKLMRRYKSFCGCKFCGEKEPVALDLHHLDPKGKDANPSTLLAGSKSRLKSEIRKCVVLCANCHRKVHAGLLIVG